MNKVVWVLGILALVSCGGEDKDKDDGPAITYATVKVDNAPKTGDAGDGTLTFTGVETCSVDASGLFQAAFSSGADKPTLTVKIKGFASSTKTYACGQASDNKSGPVGAIKYDNCMVELQTLYSTTENTLNTYSIYRETDSMTDLDYQGACTIETTYESKKVTGKIICAKMIQTRYKGQMRNPIMDNVTLDIIEGSEFFCNL